jgi:glycosyltransferase involved in cell wall biosynthesis
MQVPLVLVSNHIKTNEQSGPERLDDFAPRQDYVEIAQRLGGKLSGYDLFDAAWYYWARQIEKRIKLDLVESVFAANQCSKHNVVLSTSEKIAVPLAALLSVTKRKIPHIVIAHKLSSGLKTRLFRMWQLYKTFSHVICVCRAQTDYAVNQLGVPESGVDFVYDKVDHRFFHPLKVDTGAYVLAVGQEQRDYTTLLRAISGTGLELVILGSSPWSTSQIQMDEINEVTFLRNISYHELRALYARARLVVVPLFGVDYAAGVNALLEAMAMAKPLIVSRTKGIIDYVVHDETGVYVSPGDAEELKDRILSLWGRSKELDRLGTNARQAVEQRMNLDIYVNQVAQIVRKTIAAPEV